MNMKKILAMVFCAATVLAAMSFSVFAEGASDISDGDYIYFGNDENNKWLVLDAEQNSMGGDGMLLVLANPTEQIAFNSEKNNAWEGSNAESWCEQYVTDHFAKWENDAVISTTKTEEVVIWGKNGKATSPWVFGENTIEDSKLFFLSLQEAAEYRLAETVDTLFDYGMFWLRSPQIQQINNAGTENETIADSNPNVAVVSNTFGTKGYGTYDPSSNFYARPAFNLDTARIESVTKGDDGVWTLSLVGQPVAELWRSGSAARSLAGYHLVDSFATLKEAIYEAQDGDIIVLIDDIDEGNIKLPATIRNLTIDGNNHTISNTVISAYDGNSVDVQGLTIKNTVFDNSRFVLNGQRGGNVIYEDLVFDNNKFLNIVATGNMAAVHMNVNLEDTEYIRNFTFTNNIIDGVSGSSNSGIVIKSVDGDINISGNTITNVAWNAIQCWYSRDTADIVIENNTLSAGADEGVINLNGVKAVTVKNNNVDLKEGQPEVAYFTPVATVGDKYYASLEAALEAANDGDIITLKEDVEITEYLQISKDVIIDLGGNTITMSADTNTAGFYPDLRKCSYYITGNVTFKNGDMIVSNETYAQHGNFFVEVNKSLTFDNVALSTDGINAFALIQTYGDLNFVNGSEVVMSNEASTFIYSEENLGDVAVNDSDITLENVGAGITGSGIGFNAENATITMNNVSGKGLANVNGTVTDTSISIEGANQGIANTIGTLTVAGESEIVVTGSTEADIKLGATAGLTVAQTATVTVDKTDFAEGSAVGGEVVSKADIVYIQFQKTDLDDAGKDNNEEADVYDIVLAGYNSEKINELASADITFNFVGTPYTGAAMDYTVSPAKGVTLTQLGDSDRFMFNYNGIDKYEETGAAIVIGTIEVSGYGRYYLGTDATVTTNAVYATEIRDNIVEGFDAAGKLVVNVDMDENDQMVGEVSDVELVVPTRELMINITFPNAVENKAYEYQQMTVKVFGGDLDEALVIGLGEIPSIPDVLSIYTDKTDCEVEVVFENGAYEIEIDELLTLSNTYTVEVSGEGYRTARYTVTMTADKTLNFWNNVKDNAVNVEEKKDSSAKNVTFLAGDIVKDSVINIYDLSAVVSYFGEIDLVEDGMTQYAKYDLNRDGKIDSKDVAYVLVSWGK